MTLLERLGMEVAPQFLADRPEGGRARFSRSGLVLLILASLGASYGMFRLDVPIARFVRSLQHPLGYLLNPWLAQISSLGDWLGGGVQLVTISLCLWAIGKGLRWKAWEAVGRQTLLAHAVAALLANGLKRSLGRPRPKFSHAGEFQLWPSLDNGFDSFPSGHAAATFTVATVLARHWPHTRWVWYGIASAVSFSRVFRASHFPTDVMAGAALGVAVGWVVSHPLRAWRQSLATVLVHGAPWVVAIFSVLWVASRPGGAEPLATGCFAAGVLLVLGGLAGRVFDLNRQGVRLEAKDPSGWNHVIGGGLLTASASLPVIVLGGMALAGYWSCRRSSVPDQPVLGSHSRCRCKLSELFLAFGLLLALVVIRGLPGVFPLR